MDPQLEDLYGHLHRFQFNDQMAPVLATHNFMNMSKLQDSSLNPCFVEPPPLMTQNPNVSIVVPSVMVPSVGHVPHNGTTVFEDFDVSAVLLNYINQLLMEEDEGEKARLAYEPSALEAKEKSLYEVLGEKNSPIRDQYDLPNINYDNRFGNGFGDVDGVSSSTSYRYSGSSSASVPMDPVWSNCHRNYDPMPLASFVVAPSPSPQSLPMSYTLSNNSGRGVDTSHLSFESSVSSASIAFGSVDGPMESPVSALSVSEIFSDSQSILQFQKGLEEANKFLPKGSLYDSLKNSGTLLPQSGAVKFHNGPVKGDLVQDTRGKKHRYPEEPHLEGRGGNKQTAVSYISDEAVKRSEMFDRVLLCSKGKHEAELRESWKSLLNKNVQNDQAKGSTGGKGRGRKQGKRNVVDLRSLLSLCAQAVASNDQRGANDLLMQIRQHSSANGDGNQRMGHYFADGLEARLAGVGTPIYNGLLTGPPCAIDMLRAYHMFLAVCPVNKMSTFLSNRTISSVAEKATRLHIIDVGIFHGFQWPSLFQRLSSRIGGPPKVRLTGISMPQPGFRPAKRLEETGGRLKNYAESFGIQFEFQAIAKRWESITVSDLKIDDDEVLVVNCMFRFKYVPEETAMVECPRDMLLNLFRKLKPAVFIQGVVNGAFNSPFFITRFREALFHFSTLFDMLDVNLPRDYRERMLIEKEIFARQAMNVVACEGLERIERPETYKQWQVRIERANFLQVPLNQEFIDTAKKRVRSAYHQDFSIDKDGHWLLMGWKGRILYALATWEIV